MGRKHVIRELDDPQFQFVINAIIAGMTNREISIAFEREFSRPLAKSSIDRWRKVSGDELAERYRLTRYQAKQLLEDLKLDPDANKFQVVMSNLEDKLLTATREVIATNPVKMLQIRLEEEKRRLKERELGIKEKQLELEIAKAKAVDPGVMPGRIIEELLEFAGNDAKWLTVLKSDAKRLEEFLTEKYAA